MSIRLLLDKRAVRRIALVSWLALLAMSHGFAQEMMRVSGQVKSQDSEQALPGVNILVRGTTQGTVTDSDGKYTLSVQSNATLAFSFIGYVDQLINVNGRSVIDVVLAQDLTTLQEVVVIGYGVVKKSDLTGSVVSLKKDDLTPGANINVQQSLQGRAAGVQVYPEKW